LVRQRDIGPQARSAIDRHFPGYRFAYVAWLRLGRFSALERWVVRRRGGFLRDPSGVWSSALSLEPFQGEIPGVVVSPSAAAVLDWRFRMRLAQAWSRATIAVCSNALQTIDVLVYVNGVPITRIVAGDPSTHIFELRGVGPSAEFSFRAPGVTCSKCFGTLADLRLSLRIN